MTTDAQALAIATRALPQEPRAGLHMALIVAREETHYSDNWGPNILPGGANPNNWGAVQATRADQPKFAHLDHHADGSPYMGAYAVNPSPEAGFKQVAFEVLKPNVLVAAELGDGTGAVNAMHANGYFELAPEAYAAAASKNYDAFLAATGEPRLLNFTAPGAVPSPGAPQEEPRTADAGGGLDLFDLVLAAGVAWGMAKVAEILAPSKSAPK